MREEDRYRERGANTDMEGGNKGNEEEEEGVEKEGKTLNVE